MQCILDGNKIATREEMYIAIKSQINCHEYFGHNLDALSDVLSEMQEAPDFEIREPFKLRDHIGEDYYNRLLAMLDDCGYDIEYITTEVETEDATDEKDEAGSGNLFED